MEVNKNQIQFKRRIFVLKQVVAIMKETNYNVSKEQQTEFLCSTSEKKGPALILRKEEKNDFKCV